MYGDLTSLVIYDSVIFQPGSHVSRWAYSVERGFVRNAKRYAPERTGELMAGIEGEAFKSGPKHWEVHIHSFAEHTLYVLGGTRTPITSSRGMIRYKNGKMGPAMMRLKPYGPYPRIYRAKVRGQEANNFMEEAAEATARTHSSLRGFHPDYGF
jgi:hypothetical protein